MTKEEIALVLKNARIATGMTQSEVAKRIGRKQQTLASWEIGQSQPDANTLFTLCALYGVSVDEAFGFSTARTQLDPKAKKHALIIKKYSALDDRGQKAVDAVLDAEYSALFPPAKSDKSEQPTIEIIFIDNALASAGIGEMMGDVDQEKISVPETPTTRRADFAIRVRGDSMEPEYFDDDIVLVRKTDCVDEGDIGIFVVDGDTYIKKAGKNRLVSLNPRYQDIIGDEETQIYTMGKVIGKL